MKKEILELLQGYEYLTDEEKASCLRRIKFLIEAVICDHYYLRV